LELLFSKNLKDFLNLKNIFIFFYLIESKKFLLKILPEGINKMIFYKKIELNHVIDMKKSYMYLGNFIIEAEIILLEDQNFTHEEKYSSFIYKGERKKM
jgi:hypothetical protein